MALLVQGMRCIARSQSLNVARMIVPQTMHQIRNIQHATANVGLLAPAFMKVNQVITAPISVSLHARPLQIGNVWIVFSLNR